MKTVGPTPQKMSVLPAVAAAAKEDSNPIAPAALLPRPTLSKQQIASPVLKPRPPPPVAFLAKRASPVPQDLSTVLN